MGLNDLLHHHQVSLMRAGIASSDRARLTHDRAALDYARRINDLIGADRSGAAPLVPVA